MRRDEAEVARLVAVEVHPYCVLRHLPVPTANDLAADELARHLLLDRRHHREAPAQPVLPNRAHRRPRLARKTTVRQLRAAVVDEAGLALRHPAEAAAAAVDTAQRETMGDAIRVGDNT